MKNNLNVIFLGSFFCGKTKLINSLAGKHINNEYLPTTGINYIIKNNYYYNTKLYLWDTSGITTSRSILSSYIQNCDIICFCFENNNLESLKQMIDTYYIFSWKCNYLQKKIIIVKTKCDIIDNYDILTNTELHNFNTLNHPIVSTSSNIKNGLDDLINIINEEKVDFEKNRFTKCCKIL